jgi:O-antigen/teichoic acid export membrane protein
MFLKPAGPIPMALLNRIRRAIDSPPLMLAYSNLARAASYILPVPLLYREHGSSGAAFWLLATTIIGLQNLLFLGAPQILIRMLAVAHVQEEQGGQAGAGAAPTTRDIRSLMHWVFLGASVVITILMATAGTHFVAPIVNAADGPTDLWAAWAVIVVSSPIRIVLLRQLTYLNGRGILAVPRFVDGTAWGLSGALAFATLLFSDSLLVMAGVAHVPIIVSLIVNGRLASREGWAGWRDASTDRFLDTAKVIWPPTWRAGLGVFLSTGVRQGSGVLLARYVVPDALAGYLLAQNGIAVIMMLSAAPIQSAIHRMARAFAEARTEDHVLIAGDATGRSLWVAALLCGGVALMTPLLPMLHVAHAFVSVPLWSILAIGLFLQRYGAAHLQHYSITNHIVWHWLDGATGLINLALCTLWIPTHGAFGAAWANTVSLLVVYAWVPTMMVVRRFKLSWPSYDLKAAVLPGISLIILLGFAALMQGLLR